MTPEIRAWVIERLECFSPGRTLEIGSYDVNGNLRDLFNDYLGVDMRSGPNVDRVCNSHDLEGEFDTVLWVEGLEHDDAFWMTRSAIDRVLVPGGHVLVTAPGNGFIAHSFPNDYWRVMPGALSVLFSGYEMVHETHLQRYNTSAYCGRRI